MFRLSAQEVGGDTITGKVHQIEKVTVTARRSPNKVTSAVPVQTMSQQDISRLGIQNMADAVRRFAGANVKDYGGIGGLKTVSIRNMGAAHTAVSYDGVAVSNCQAGQIDIGRFHWTMFPCFRSPSGSRRTCCSLPACMHRPVCWA